MHKFLSILVALCSVTLLFTACSKSLDKVLDRRNGKWHATITTILSIDNETKTTIEQSGTYFFDGKKYTLVMADGATGSGTWNAEASKVTFISDSEVVVVDVVNSGRKEQEWRRIYTVATESVDIVSEMTYKLKR